MAKYNGLSLFLISLLAHSPGPSLPLIGPLSLPLSCLNSSPLILICFHTFVY